MIQLLSHISPRLTQHRWLLTIIAAVAMAQASIWPLIFAPALSLALIPLTCIVLLWIYFGRIELSIMSLLPAIAISIPIYILSPDFAPMLTAMIYLFGSLTAIPVTRSYVHKYTYGSAPKESTLNNIVSTAVIGMVCAGGLFMSPSIKAWYFPIVCINAIASITVANYFLVPFLLRRLTILEGEPREYPATLKRWALSIYSFAAFLIGIGFFIPTIFIYNLFVKDQARRSRFVHDFLYKFSNFVIKRVPGTSFKLLNPHGEDLQRPALIICNHQSQLDLMAILAMGKSVTILTKDWVWRNPFYGYIIRTSEFYPVTNGIDNYLNDMRDMIRRGYSIAVFPEGTRSAAGIQRFHKGAFVLAQQLELDILPVYLHGFNHVLPRHDFMLRSGSMTMEIGQRMPVAEVMATSSMELRKTFHKQYVRHFEQMRRQFETSEYFLPFVRYKYLYKGLDIELQVQRTLNNGKELASEIDRDFSSVESYSIEENGYGETALLYALTHPNIEIYAEFTDPDKLQVATQLQGLPPNLHLSQAYNLPYL